MALTAEPATFPYVLALRWLTADADAREQLIESVLTSDLVRLSPAAARGLMRAAQAADGTVGAALEHTEGLIAGRGSRGRFGARCPGARGDRGRHGRCSTRSASSGRTSRTRRAWWRTPSAPPAHGARSTSSSALSGVVAEAGDSPDPSAQAFLESLDAGEHGPGIATTDPRSSDAVHVLTAHGAVGAELDTVVVAGAVEGNFPSLSRPEPMFDLAALERPISQSERNRARLEDERRLFRMMLGRAQDQGRADRERDARRRVGRHVAVRRRARRRVDARSRGAVRRTGVGARGRPPRGGAPSPTSTCRDARRLAALEGLVALGVDPGRWWFQRGWTDTGAPLHETIRVSYSRLSTLENCELQYVLVRGARAREHGRATRRGWARPSTGSSRTARTARVERTLDEAEGRGRRALAPAGVPVHGRFRGVAAPGQGSAAPELVRAVRRASRHRHRARVRVRVRRRDAHRLHRPDRPDPLGFGTRITDYKTGGTYNMPKANESLQLGIYYLAVAGGGGPEGGRRRSPASSSRTSRATTGPASIEMREWEVGSGEREAEYQQRMRERLSWLIAELRRLDARGALPAEPAGRLLLLRLQDALPAVSAGRAVVLDGRRIVSEPAYPPEIVAVMGGASRPTSNGARSRGRWSRSCWSPARARARPP